MENEIAVRYLDDADATANVDQKSVDCQLIGRKRTHSKTDDDDTKSNAEEAEVKASGDDHQSATEEHAVQEPSKSPTKETVEAESEVGESVKTAVENVEGEFSNCSVKSAEPSQEVKPAEQSSSETQEEVDAKPKESAAPDEISAEKTTDEDVPKAPSSKKQKSK